MLFAQSARRAMLSTTFLVVVSMYTLTVGALVYMPAGTPRFFGRTMSPQERTVYNPEITSPDASTVWVVGDTVEITWDTSHIPDDSTATGEIVLGYLTHTGETSEHLDMGHPLAKGFLLTRGHANVEVPDVNPGGNYIAVLMGDSGNRSPEFTIEAAH